MSQYAYSYTYPGSIINGGIVESFDIDAIAYFVSAGITGSIEKNAVNQLFLDIKGIGSTTNDSDIYAKFVALYLVSPTSLAASAVNAVNPSTFDLTWVNSPTHATTGVTLNGTTQYGKTGIIPSTDLIDSDISMGVYCRTEVQKGGFMGCLQSTSQRLWFSGRTGGDNAQANVYNTTVGLTVSNLIAKAFNTYSRRSGTDQEIYKNGVSLTSNALGGGTVPTIEMYIGGRNNAGSPDELALSELAGCYVSSGLTDNEMTDLFDAMDKYQTNVISGGRNV